MTEERLPTQTSLDTRADGVTVERCTDPRAWDSFVEQNGGSPFTTWRWGEVVESYGPERYYFVAKRDGDIIGAAPLFYFRSRLFGDKLVAVPFASRGSLVLDDDHWTVARNRLFALVESLADTLGVGVASLQSRDLGERALFKHKQRYVAYEVPVGDGLDAVWDEMYSCRKSHIEQAEADGVRVTVGTDESDLRTFYKLYLQTMRGHGSPPHSYRFFQHLWEQFHEDGTMRVYIAECDGRPINSTVDFAFGSWVFHWKQVSDYDYRDRNGGSLLVWKGLKWAAENGFETFDLGRTREGSGVYLFKKRFGGEKVWMDDYHYFPDGKTQLLDPEQEKYDRVKQLWQKIPLPVTKVIGPPIRKAITL
ncbi:lipid II:glycine glycyltransferase FemX [Haloarchaeobius sp. DFWS5]|uniref:lipid II:glycine glycyltransferase FemX n=1 Tax=Haloarchaeobius sp. DFWS5 TaxID=3446114 RepID=UPI003EB7006E